MQEWSVPGWAAVGVLAAAALVVVLCGLLVVVLVRERARTARTLAAAQSDADALRHQVEAIEQRLAEPTPAPAPRTDPEYVITRLGEVSADDRPEPADGGAVGTPATVPAPLFADLVLRETVVQAASLAAGLRRALAPEVRNRIRFEMRREVKRARKQRRADHRLAVREWQARQRGSAA